ncbi:MAG: hypothetical protein K1X44_02115 [Alphaproteobacteria bacterium]|nr:hypothetical protein [Alphaproteobacteria bacterium]
MKKRFTAPFSLNWFFLRQNGSSAYFIHRFQSRELWRRKRWFARLVLCIKQILAPFIGLIIICLSIYRNGWIVKKRVGKSLTRQFLDQVPLALTYPFLPRWYYIFELYEDRKYRLWKDYLYRFETKRGIYSYLKRIYQTKPRVHLKNKIKFNEICHRNNLAHIPIFASFLQGQYINLNNNSSVELLPSCDLFFKPTLGRGGYGIERWDYVGEGKYSNNSKVLPAAELIDQFRILSHIKPFFVQPRIKVHQELEDLANGALSTIRVVSIEDEHGNYEITHAIFRMAVGNNHTVDNFHAGGIAAAVNIETGTLGLASDIGLNRNSRWHEIHPTTHAKILGRQLPLWKETCELVKQAHSHFGVRLIIGWDIAICSNKPVIVEGNGRPDLDIIQRIGQRPAGNERLGQLLVYHLKRYIKNETKN